MNRKLFHLRKEFHKDAKKAKTFETQRSIKRLKAVRKKLEESPDKCKQLQQEVATHEKEMDLLKLIEIRKLSDKVFLNGINKHRALKNIEIIQAYLAANETCRTQPLFENGASSDDAILRKVEARLLSSKSLREALLVHLDDLLYAVTGTEATRNTGSKDVKDQQKGLPPTKKVANQSTKDLAKRKDKPVIEKSFETSSNGDDNDEEDEDEDYESEDDTIDPHDLPLEELEKLLAAEEDEDMSGKEVGDKVPAASRTRNKVKGEKAVSSTKESRKEKKPQPTTAKVTRGKGNADSMFVNSLGDGGSDFDDPEFDKIYGSKKTKNRMGQQARRALAERIHGENAKHKIAERAAAEAAAAAVAARRARARRGRDDVPSKPTSKPIEKPAETLHPSWEAAKHRRNIGIVPAQGKKIVFGDDDAEPAGEPRARDSAATTAAPKLHPSWEAAKLKTNQSSIVKGQKQNSKIVFDD